MKIIVGLGNPGDKYQSTRHNIGFDIVDLLAERWGCSFKKCRFEAVEASAQWQDQRVQLIKPQTFMNLSGQAVVGALQFYKSDLNDLLVIHDDLDLTLGRLKWASGGSAGGHNGVSSIIESIGSKDFFRLRVGIGRPTTAMDTVNWVLSRFTSAEKEVVKTVKEKAFESVEFFFKNGLSPTMNRYNLQV